MDASRSRLLRGTPHPAIGVLPRRQLFASTAALAHFPSVP
jgi:hypothetical protein